MSTIESRSHFSIPIYSQAIAGFDEQRPALVACLLDLQQESAGLSLSNRGGFHSANDLHRRDAPPLVWMRDAITNFARTAMRERHGPDVDVSLTEMWANVAGRGAWHTPHEHFPAHWSGAFHVAAQHCVNATDAQDRGGKIEFMNPIPLARAFGMPTSVTYTPRDGVALLFPGALVHLVHPNPVDDLRISVSFNLNLTR